MDAIINGYDETPPLARETLHALAAELPLENILVELRRFYRTLWEDCSPQTDPDCHQICDSCLRCLDSALWRLETQEGNQRS